MVRLANPHYVWCLHCERAYEEGHFRSVKPEKAILKIYPDLGDLELCAYSDCDGSADIDVKDWDFIQKLNPEYPLIPESGIVYPLYSKKI